MDPSFGNSWGWGGTSEMRASQQWRTSRVEAGLQTSLAVQWLGLCASTARGTCSIPGGSTKILHAMWYGQKKKKKKKLGLHQFSSIQFSRSVVSSSLRPHESQHARPPCPSPTPRVHSDSHPSSQRCHPAISSSVVPSPPAPNPSQHRGLFQWVNSLHEVQELLFYFQIYAYLFC